MINELVSNNIGVSLVSNPSKIENYDYGMTLTKETGGIVINTNYNNDENVAEKMYRHVFNDPDDIVIITPTNYKVVKLDGVITIDYLKNSSNEKYGLVSAGVDKNGNEIELYDRVNNSEGFLDSDKDGLYDFEEIMFYWNDDSSSTKNQTISWDSTGRAIFPTFKEICERLSDKYKYFDKEKVNSELTKEQLNDEIRVLPIKSDPTLNDSDEDGITDYNERVAIEEYKKNVSGQAENNGRKYYICSLNPIKKDTVETIVESEFKKANKDVARIKTFNEHCSPSNGSALWLNVSDNNITINANVEFIYHYSDGNADKTVTSLDNQIPSDILDKYKKAINTIKSGIKDNWGGDYTGTKFDFYPGMNIHVDVNLNEKTMYSNKKNKYIRIEYFNKTGSGYAHLSKTTYAWNDTKYYINLYQYVGNENETPKESNALSDKKLKEAAAHEFGHILGLSDAYLRAFLNKINGYNYIPYNLLEVPENEIMAFAHNKVIASEVNANDIEMILMSAIEQKPQSFIHHLSENADDKKQKAVSNVDLDYSEFVLSKAIRTPTVVLKRCKIDGDGNILNTSYWAINETSLDLNRCIGGKQDSDSDSETEINSWIIDYPLGEYYNIS